MRLSRDDEVIGEYPLIVVKLNDIGKVLEMRSM